MKTAVFERLVGQPCWHVSVGGSTLPTFELVAGDRIARPVPLTNPSQSEEFRRCRGSIQLLVWSSWRLQTETDVLATSDAGDEIVAALRAVVGSSILDVRCDAPAWDLRLNFANGLQIVTFSDRIGTDANAQNWELWAFGRYVGAGPGERWQEADEEVL